MLHGYDTFPIFSWISFFELENSPKNGSAPMNQFKHHETPTEKEEKEESLTMSPLPLRNVQRYIKVNMQV